MGMTVIYYDVLSIMAMGKARQVPTLPDLLAEADFVTLHVPDLPETRNMFSTDQFAQMKTGSYLINASRGTVVDIPALIEAMTSGKVAGAALDVYPNEPAANGDYFNNDLNQWGEQLRALPNVILTPHIGGSTEEAQRAIGVEGNDLSSTYSTGHLDNPPTSHPPPLSRTLSQASFPSDLAPSSHCELTYRSVPSRRGPHQVHQPGCDSWQCEHARGEPPIAFQGRQPGSCM
jgi:D-3-phosphoglycerate dehydrogenase